MTTTNALEITVQSGNVPSFRQDILVPLHQGRVNVEGVSFKFSGPGGGGFANDPKYQEGDFGLLDTNMGDVFPAINAGWNIKLLPAFVKHKPVWNYLFVRSDRGINSPKDLEGKTIATSGWGVVTVWTRGLLQRFYGVDISKIHWVANNAGRWELYKPADVEYPGDGKRQEMRLLDGEADGSTGDITDIKIWDALENSPEKVKRLFPNYREVHRQMFRDHGVITPANVWVMGGKLDQEHPGLARKLFDALNQSKDMAYQDGLADIPQHNLLMDARELLRDQIKEFGDMHKLGLKANKNTIDMLFDFYYEQGQTKSRLSYEQVFAESTLDT